MAINYNRDVEIFPVIKRILDKITSGASLYKSPTDMGVNKASYGIIGTMLSGSLQTGNNQAIFWYNVEYIKGSIDRNLDPAELLMKNLGLNPEDRR